MNHTTLILSLGIVCLLAMAVAFAGCTGTGNTAGPTLPPTPVQASHLVVTQEQNKATVSVNPGSVITVRLQENPTTGYQWNLTTTPGLRVISDNYVPSDTTGKLVGSGGTRVWEISATAKGEQKINAFYMRSWEPVTGNETGFLLTVMVI
ncbi:MAG: protease inhibitor I42 family protein [Methanoregula sp.]|nr:protease inhibitor I42 family protein [Methanoregula sp.]